MSMRRFRARLDRLEKMANARDCGFTVDPMLARAVRELNDLLGSRDDLPGEPQSEHEKQLHARIAERAKAIGCPAGYGAEQARKDGHRLEALLSKRRSPRRRGGPPRNSLSAAEYAEEARLTWCIVAFDQSPEGCARERISELEWKSLMAPFGSEEISAAEQTELDHLRTLYPDLPLDPDDVAHQILIRMNEHEAKKRAMEVEARKHAQENCAAVASCNDGVGTAMEDSDDLDCFPEQVDRFGTRKRAWNDDVAERQLFLGEIGNLYGRKQLSPPFSLKEYATRWMADGIPRAHCVEQVRKHLDTSGHQYRVGSGDKGISWVDDLIRATWQSGNPQLKRAPGSQRGR
jgi:hypothetical protein